MADLFDTLGGDPGGENSEMPQPMEEPAAEENQVLAEAAAEPEVEEGIEVAGEDAGLDVSVVGFIPKVARGGKPIVAGIDATTGRGYM